jgi:hypothetical protein
MILVHLVSSLTIYNHFVSFRGLSSLSSSESEVVNHFDERYFSDELLSVIEVSAIIRDAKIEKMRTHTYFRGAYEPATHWRVIRRVDWQGRFGVACQECETSAAVTRSV